MTSSSDNGLYYIQQVADMTGLSKQVIRKWEERYGLVRPERLPNGYRVYSEKDINALMHVKALSDQGYPLKQAVEKIQAKDSANTPFLFKAAPVPQQKALNDYVFKLLERGTHCDELELHFILQQAYHQIGLSAFLSDIIIPFLHEVGSRWERGEWSEFQESVSSLIVRDFLVQIRRNYQFRDEAPLVLGACLPGELHEIPLHILLLKFMIKGWKTMLVGASPAPLSIQALVEKMQPAKVVLSAVTSLPFETYPSLLTTLDEFAEKHPHIQFYLGGYGAFDYAKDKQLEGIKVTASFDDVFD